MRRTGFMIRRLGRAVLSMAVLGAGALLVMAASAIPTVRYGGSVGGQAVSTITSAVQGVATDIRDILGVTALLAFVVAALVNHFVHDPRSKDRAREIVVAAIVGLLVAVFAPTIINFILQL